MVFHCLSSRDCNRVDVNTYDLSLDFKVELECVDGFLLSANVTVDAQIAAPQKPESITN